ncbi:MAG: hypothetical protein OEM97_01310 [Acidimicrobiia bacterium]|nr:hypothetical protein [Acidimicrobiia bacterium]
MTLLDVAARFHGRIGLELGSDGPRATLTVGLELVRIDLDTGEAFTYDRADVLWSPLDETTVRVETASARAFFTADAPLDFTQLANPVSHANRRLPGSPSIESAWTVLDDEGPVPEHRQTRPTSSHRKRATCTHRRRELRLIGGTYRRACVDCGDVTIDVTGTHAEPASQIM